ncbi:IclR family transcriptional regulator [Yinghuangia aomiensis]
MHRLANELVGLWLLDREPDGYRLGGGLFELGMRAAAERGLLELAMPFLQDLYERTHEIVHLGVREGTDVAYVAKTWAATAKPAPSRVGGRMPMHCTGIGKCAASCPRGRRPAPRSPRRAAGPAGPRTPWSPPGALRRQLDAALETGVAFEYEESTASAWSTSPRPSLGSGRRTRAAAISVAGPSPRFRPDDARAALRAAATALGGALARRDARSWTRPTGHHRTPAAHGTSAAGRCRTAGSGARHRQGRAVRSGVPHEVRHQPVEPRRRARSSPSARSG